MYPPEPLQVANITASGGDHEITMFDPNTFTAAYLPDGKKERK
jgi:hypothetical protein